MRVLQLISSNGFYGAERVVTLLSAQLKQLKCEIRIVAFNASRDSQREFVRSANQSGIRVWNLACSGRCDPRAVLRLVRLIRRYKPDVVHTHGYKANIYGIIAARLTGRKLLATCHNWTEQTPGLQLYAAVDRLCLRGFNGVVAVSETVARRLTGVGFSGDAVQVIHNGVETAKYFEQQPPSSQVGPPVIVTLSRLSHEKGIDILLRALPYLLRCFPDLHCIVLGEGPERASLEALARDLQVTEHLEMPGFTADIREILARCSVVVHPSRIEGMPLALLESMAAGKPIVATNVGGVPSLLCHGQAGLLVPPEDSQALAEGVVQMLVDSDLQQRCGAVAGQEARERYDAGLMAGHYLGAYRALFKGGSRRQFDPGPLNLNQAS